jgi:hypothetical protein
VLGVTIDTAVFAPPPIGSVAGDVFRFIETLLHWKDAMDDGAIDIYRSKFAQEVLMRCDLYPMRPQLKQLFAGAGVVAYDANTVGVWAEKLFSGSIEIEPILGISDVLLGDLTVDPDVFAAIAPDALRDEAHRCAVILSVANRFGPEEILRAHAMAVRAAGVRNAINVRALIEDIEHSRQDLDGLALAPQYFDGSVVACSGFNDFLLSLDAVTILRAATGSEDVAVAVRLGLYRAWSTRGNPRDWSDLPSFRLGLHFFDSLVEHHVMSGSGLADRVMRCLLETVGHEKLADTHALRTGQGGGNPQRARGKDLAWRRDVDREYHLHYWECDTGIVELARLVVHNDFSIPE